MVRKIAATGPRRRDEMQIQINDHGDNHKFNFKQKQRARSEYSHLSDTVRGSDRYNALPAGNFKFVARPRVFVTGCPTLDTSRDALA